MIELRIWAACEHSSRGDPRVCMECLSREGTQALKDAVSTDDLRTLVAGLKRYRLVTAAAEALVAIPNVPRLTYLGEWEDCAVCGSSAPRSQPMAHAPDCAWQALVKALK